MRITSKGQVTIPLEVRERLGLLPNTEVEFTIRGDAALLTKAGARRRGPAPRGTRRSWFVFAFFCLATSDFGGQGKMYCFVSSVRS